MCTVMTTHFGCDPRAVAVCTGPARRCSCRPPTPSLASRPRNLRSNIKIAILDQDGGLISSVFSTAVSRWNPGYGFSSVPPNTTEAQLWSSVNDGHVHMGIVLRSGASAALLASRFNSSAPYSPAAALTYFYDQGRAPQVSRYTIMKQRTSSTVIFTGS